MIEVHHNNTIVRTFILFVQTASSVLKYADAYFYHKCRLSIIKFIVLQALSTNGMMTPSDLALWTNTERHNITTLINRLKKAGLVNVKRNQRDKRYLNITITDDGQRTLTEAIPVAKEIMEQVMASLSEDDALLLEISLKCLIGNASEGHRDMMIPGSVTSRTAPEATPVYF